MIIQIEETSVNSEGVFLNECLYRVVHRYISKNRIRVNESDSMVHRLSDVV